METYDARCDKYLAESYWPWPLALAFVQPDPIRAACVNAVCTAYDTCDKYEQGGGRFSAYTALAMLCEAATGQRFDGDHCLDPLAELEVVLLGPMRADQIAFWARRTPDGPLDQLSPIDLVGCEIAPEGTADIVKAGWRGKSPLLCAIGENDKIVVAYDVHLLSSAVRQLGAAIDHAAKNRQLDELAFSGSGAFDVPKPEPLKGGYWSLFCTIAWVATRSPDFVAKVQTYEERRTGALFGEAAGALSLLLSDAVQEQFSFTVGEAARQLRESLADGELQGKALDIRTGERRLVSADEWDNLPYPDSPHGQQMIHDHRGTSFSEYLYDCRFPSKELRQVFLEENHYQASEKRLRNDCPDADILAECDERWLAGARARDLDRLIPRLPKFDGVKAERVRGLVTDRYRRVGRGVRTPDCIKGSPGAE